MTHLMQKLMASIVLLCLSVSVLADNITVGSKNFSESYVLAELMAQILEADGHIVDRRFGLGGTLVCYEALEVGEIDVYAEYTGTLSQVILKRDEKVAKIAVLNEQVKDRGLKLLDSFGFNNTYAMALKESLAKRLNITRVSQLTDHADLKYAFSLEFLNREDGWPGFKQSYGLVNSITGIEHGLAYQAIDNDKIDVTDAYSTDGDLARYKLTTLEDDNGFFPQYLAAPFHRLELSPGVVVSLNKLSGRIDDATMRGLNGRVVVDGLSFAEAATEFLAAEGLINQAQVDASKLQSENEIWRNLYKNVVIHLQLTSIALVLGLVFGLGIGMAVFRHHGVSKVVVYIAGLLQTVPSIALLALMIPLFGIGMVPAIIALFLYSILPILRNTITALVSIDPLMKRVSEAIGLTPRQQVRYILLPMAMPTILAGIRTATVISIGTATLAAFIGAGGLGEPIVTGLALNDVSLILQGALPAAALAIFAELMFEGVERLIVKPHMLKGQLPS